MFVRHARRTFERLPDRDEPRIGYIYLLPWTMMSILPERQAVTSNFASGVAFAVDRVRRAQEHGSTYILYIERRIFAWIRLSADRLRR